MGGMYPGREVLERIAERGNAKTTGKEDEGEAEEGGAEAEAAAMEVEERGEDPDEEEILKKLHSLLIETSVQEGKLVCGNCGFEYPIKEGVGNFLLPGHLV